MFAFGSVAPTVVWCRPNWGIPCQVPTGIIATRRISNQRQNEFYLYINLYTLRSQASFIFKYLTYIKTLGHLSILRQWLN